MLLREKEKRKGKGRREEGGESEEKERGSVEGRKGQLFILPIRSCVDCMKLFVSSPNLF